MSDTHELTGFLPTLKTISLYDGTKQLSVATANTDKLKVLMKGLFAKCIRFVFELLSQPLNHNRKQLWFVPCQYVGDYVEKYDLSGLSKPFGFYHCIRCYNFLPLFASGQKRFPEYITGRRSVEKDNILRSLMRDPPIVESSSSESSAHKTKIPTFEELVKSKYGITKQPKMLISDFFVDPYEIFFTDKLHTLSGVCQQIAKKVVAKHSSIGRVAKQYGMTSLIGTGFGGWFFCNFFQKDYILTNEEFRYVSVPHSRARYS